MRVAIIIVAISSAVLGFCLLWLALGVEGLIAMAAFILIGALAIWAAIAYTAGSLPYGYVGLGDLAVLAFFGWVAVAGSYLLQTHELSAAIVLPATSCGLFAVGVLNVNNIRDIESDRLAGKQSIPVRLGLRRARHYHWGLLLTGLLLAMIYVVADYHVAWQFLFLASLPLIVHNGRAVSSKPPAEIDPYLGQLSISTLVFVVLFGIGQILAGQS
jgi:1,4-dihydroxy-2-naphthoate octaprenyltransferase